MRPGKETRDLRNKLKSNRSSHSVIPTRPKKEKKTRQFVLIEEEHVLYSTNPKVDEKTSKVDEQPTKHKKIIDLDKFRIGSNGESKEYSEDKNNNKVALRVMIYCAFLAAIVLLFYLITPLSTLDQVNVGGNSQLDAREVYELSGVRTGDKMYFIQPERVVEQLEEIPLIESAIVTKEGFGTINIHILEVRTVAYLPSDEGFYPLQESGYMVPNAVESPTLGPLLYHFDQDNIRPMLGSLGALDEEIVANISEIYARPIGDNKSRIQLYMNDGQVVIADIETFSDKFGYYMNLRGEIEDSSAGVIDLEVGNSFLPYSSSEARELMASIYGESLSQAEQERRDALVAPLEAVFESFSVQ